MKKYMANAISSGEALVCTHPTTAGSDDGASSVASMVKILSGRSGQPTHVLRTEQTWRDKPRMRLEDSTRGRHELSFVRQTLRQDHSHSTVQIRTRQPFAIFQT